MALSDREVVELVSELLEVEEGLSEWEVEFIESLADETLFTTAQAAKVQEIAEKVL
jgi:hypothetical protein